MKAVMPIKLFITTIMFALSSGLMAHPLIAIAAPAPTSPPTAPTSSTGETDATVDSKGKITCPDGSVATSGALDGTPKCVGQKNSDSNNPIYVLLRDVIRVMSGIFGLVLVLILVIAGFQYTISNGSPDDSKSAKNRIKAAITGFVLYIFMVGILQLLLPEGTKIFGQ